MAYKCRICGSNDVDNPGDVCELCAIGADPYATALGTPQAPRDVNKGAAQQDGSGYTPKHAKNRRVLLGGASTNTDPYGNDMTPAQADSSVQVYAAGQVPQQAVSQPVVAPQTPAATGNEPITTGITKNITVDTQKRSVLVKWFQTLFGGIPFALDDDVTMFQVFPDYTGTSLNAMGNACDQVIVYGRLNNGSVSENNDVEVYGHRDSRNNIIAKTIKNKASGTIIKPQRTVAVGVIWVVTLLVTALLVGLIAGLGVEGIIWTAVIVLCLTNLPLVFKVIGAVFGAVFSLIKSILR